MLDIQNISAAYGDHQVLHDFSWTIPAGKVVSIIGPNGCGKSTLLRCAAGLLALRRGKITVAGDDIATLDGRERARRLALLPQSFEGGSELTVDDMVALGRTPHLPPYGSLGAHDRAIVQNAMEAVDAAVLRGRRVGELSGGERQRVILARALAQEPQVLLLDEPTSNLDIHYQYEILALARRLARRQGLAVVLILHQINLAAAVADSIVLLNPDGTTRAAGTPGAVMTAENLTAVYRTPLRVVPHPETGRPQAQSMFVFEE